MLSIIIPAYNEEKRLPGTLAAIAQFFAGVSPPPPLSLLEVIVVNDGSTDNTAQAAAAFRDVLPVSVISLPENRGKGAALREGVQAATGAYVLLDDADAATPIRELHKLAPGILAGSADIVIGSRMNSSGDAPVSMQWHRRFVGRVYHGLCARLHPGVRDAACGFKLFTAAAAKTVFAKQRIDRFAYDVEILAIAHDEGLRIAEVPVAWTAVPGSKVNLLTDSGEMFWAVLKLYARRRNRRGSGQRTVESGQ